MIRHLPTASLDGRIEDGLAPHGGALRDRLIRASGRCGCAGRSWRATAALYYAVRKYMVSGLTAGATKS